MFDLRLVRQALRFVVRAPGRHQRLAAGSFAWVLGLCIALAVALPRVWRIEAEVLSAPLPAALAMHVPRGAHDDGLLRVRGALEKTLSQKNLAALIEETELLGAWERARPLPLRLKDALLAKVRGPLTQEQKLDALVDMVEERLTAEFNGPVLSLSFDWFEPQSGARFVAAAQRSFISFRHDSEMQAVNEAVGILQSHHQEAASAFTVARQKLHQLREAGSSDTVARANAAGEVLQLRARAVELEGRLLDARVAADATRSALMRTDTVLRAAEIPRGPVKPHLLGMVAAGFLAGILVALLAAVAADLRAGRIVEASQVQLGLGLPVLGEVRER